MPAIQLASISASASELVKRQYGYGYNSRYGYNSPWNNYGRWILLGVIIVVALVAFFLVSCLNARRRRKRGNAPVYGTAWMAPGHGAVNYYGPNGQNNTQQPYYNPETNNNNNTDYAPPAYPATNGGGANASYYGQQNGIELQQPQQAYTNPGRGGEETYAAPEGPPPKKRGLFK